MSVKFGRFGAFAGNPDEDLRIDINAPGAKTPLIIVASWLRIGLGPILGSTWGRVIVFEGAEFQGPAGAAEFRPDSTINLIGDKTGGRVLFDVIVTDPTGNVYLPPIADLEGFRASKGGRLTIMQSVLVSSNAGDHFRPFLTVGGQTIFQGS